MAARCAKREGKSKASWYGRVTWTEPDGRRRWAHVSAPTRKACEQKAAETLAAGRAGETYAKRTFAQEAEDWLAWKGGTVKPQSVATYRTALAHHVLPVLGRLPLSRVTPAAVESVAAAMVAAGQAPSHAKYVHDVACAVLRRAERLQRIPRNPCDRAVPPRAPRFAPAPLASADVRRLLDLAAADPYAVLWRFQVFAGLRTAEVAGLKWEDVDWEKGLVAVRRQRRPVDGAVVEMPPKSAAGVRVIALPADVMAGLAAERDRQAARHGKASAYVFCARHGGPLSISGLRLRWLNLRAKAGLPGMRFHDLRHTQGVLLAEAGVHPKVAQARLGHANLRMTMDVYTHVVGGMDRQAADALEKLLGQREESVQKPGSPPEESA